MNGDDDDDGDGDGSDDDGQIFYPTSVRQEGYW